MAFLGQLGAPKARETVNSLLDKGDSMRALRKLQQDIDLITKYRITQDEDKRISSSNAPGGLLDLTNLRSFMCFINCTMRLTSAEMKDVIQLVNTFKQTRAQILALPPATSIDEIRALYTSLKEQKQRMLDLRTQLQAKYPPSATREVAKPAENNSIRPGGTQWAENLARTYTSLGGPTGVSTNQFIQFLQNRRSNLSPEEQRQVHGALSEFGSRRNNAAITMKNFMKKSGITVPKSLRNIINLKKGGRRKTRKPRKMNKTRKN